MWKWIITAPYPESYNMEKEGCKILQQVNHEKDTPNYIESMTRVGAFLMFI